MTLTPGSGIRDSLPPVPHLSKLSGDEHAIEHSPDHDASSEPTRASKRGEPQLFFTCTAGQDVELAGPSSASKPSVNLPLPQPPRCIRLETVAEQPRIVPGGTGVKESADRIVHESVSPVRFAGGEVADVFPWKGDNAEDALSETLIKSGFSNKPQIMNETNTARPSLWSSLKNKSGIATLSSLFVAVLEKRQQSNRLQEPNTFKPPPRLTLRDSTREQWLHDLANPSIGLRRLSRTIPHGLTGKLLLDQCLNKNIPLPRASWLAKCVGINELRAHKRKGQAGTATWSRGWTSSVEQFVDGVVGTITQGDWRSRITYALQLATHFYTQHLLDEDHFLDWIVTNIDACSSERLFVWLLVISVSHYWKDITCCRQRGKRLAESLLNQLEQIYCLEDHTPYATLLSCLENTFVRLLATRPPCFLLPSSWGRYGRLLHTLAEKRNHPQLTLAVKKLEHRNNRLMQTTGNGALVPQTHAGRVYQILDSINYHSPLSVEEIFRECMKATSDGTELIAILLNWACTCYRTGVYRLYLVTRLLRRWSHLGQDVYEGIVSYLSGKTWVETGEPSCVFKIVAELVRSRTFPVGRYLQWLIATGSLAHDAELSLPRYWPMRLLIEIPLRGLSDEVCILRSTLLKDTVHSPEFEMQNLEQAECLMTQALPSLFGLDSSCRTPSKINLEQLSSTAKFELSNRLRRHVSQFADVNEHVPTEDSTLVETATVSLLTVQDFHIVRSYLELFGDLAILADVVGIAASTLDPFVLASIADTLTFHQMGFRAIGALDPLFGKVAVRYAAIRTVQMLEREALLSLYNLACALRDDGQFRLLLNFDLSRVNQKTFSAAFSPASDNMDEAMLVGASSDDEIEWILSSGTSMDEHMMARVFRKIMTHLEEYNRKFPMTFGNHPIWFHRLRCFDDATFDMVVREWVKSHFMAHQVEALQAALPILIGSSFLTIATFLELYQTCIVEFKQSPSEVAFQTALQTLQFLLPSHETPQTCLPQDGYRFRLEQQRLHLESAAQVVLCIRDVVELASAIFLPSIQNQLPELLSSEAVLTVVKHSISLDASCLSKLSQASTGYHIKPLFDALLDPNSRLHLSEKPPEQQVPAIFSIVSDLSVPICEAAIKLIFSSHSALPGTSVDTLCAALLDSLMMVVQNGQSAGLQLIASLDAAITGKIRKYAERGILDASAFFTLLPTVELKEHEKPSAAVGEKFLTILNLTPSESEATTDKLELLLALTERLEGIARSFDDYGPAGEVLGQANSQYIFEIYAWLNALLRLAVTDCSMILSKANHQDQIAFMLALNSLYVHSVFETYPSISEHVFDVAVFLSDHITNDVRNHLARLDAVRQTNDPRCHFVLSMRSSFDGWLVLARPVNQPVNYSSPQPPTRGSSQSPPPQPLQNSSQTPTVKSFALQERNPNSQQQRQQQTHITTPLPQHPVQPNRTLPAQLQQNSSNPLSPTPFQQMQQMQQMQGLAQQRATRPSLVHTQRPTPTASPSLTAPAPSTKQKKQEKDMKQYLYVQPRWEILAESSGNPNANETAISLTLFGARKV